jgi:CHAT domain-containing protein
LERATDKHLTPGELDIVLSGGSGLASGPSAQDLGSVYAHISVCAQCRSLADRQLKAQAALNQLRIEHSGSRAADCSSNDELLKCAAGVLPVEESERCLQHAIACDHCGPLLKNATEIFADELTPEQEALIALLDSSKVLWQRELAHRLERMVGRPISEGPPAGFFSTYWLRAAVFVAAAVTLCVIGLSIFQHRALNNANEVGKLLDQAYSERRLMDLRLFGAAYGPVAVRRGAGESSSLDRPASLLQAEAQIAGEIRKHPDDIRWQIAKARADLVEGNLAEAAAGTLERVLESRPDDAVRLDLASAYFQLAQTTNQPSGYGKAANLLGEVISKEPRNPVARFNRAIVLERLYLYQQAEEDWKYYLELDTGSEWAEEARSRLAALREKIKQQRNRSSRPLLSPSEFSTKYKATPAQEMGVLDSDIERYRDQALRTWLVQAFPKTSSDPGKSRSAREGLNALAQVFRQQHKDTWLEDLLKSEPNNPRFSGTVAWLSETYQDDAAGKYAEVEALARQAERRDQTNEAVRIEAQWQLLFANRLSLRTQACLTTAERLWREVDRTEYQWLRVRILLDYSQCADHNNRVQLAKDLNGKSLLLSAQYGFPDLFLRATKISADLALQTEDAQASMSGAVRGLQSFWKGDVTYMSGYNLMTTIDDAAESEELWYLDASVIAEALQLLGDDPDVGMRAVEQQRLANALLLSGNLSGANENLMQARTLLSTLPDDDASKRKLTEIEVEVAKLDLLRGRPDDSLIRLRRIRGEVLRASDDYLSFDFLVAYGKALRLTGAKSEAKDTLSSAIRIAQKGLRDLPDERDRLRWSRHCSPAYREIVRMEITRDPSAAFSLWESFKGASLARSSFTGKELRLKQNLLGAVFPATTHQSSLRGFLRPGALSVSFAVFDDGVSAWVYDGNTISQQWITIQAESIERYSRRFAADCANPNSDLGSLQRDGKELYRILFGPLAALLSSYTSLVIEPDKILEQIPFAALVDNQGGYLGDRYSLSISPGFDYLRESSPAPSFSRESRALVVADSSSHPELGVDELPGAESEARSVASSFSHPRLFLGEKASPLAVADALPAAELFHFAGHAVVNASFAGLVLHGEVGKPRAPLLTATDISENGVGRLHLVVLSACASAKGKQGGVTDAESLARSLVAQGVDQVVASRWPVDSSSTTVLMGSFYRHLLDREPTAAALRAAEKELRERKGFQHPFYWAAFSVFGNV